MDFGFWGTFKWKPTWWWIPKFGFLPKILFLPKHFNVKPPQTPPKKKTQILEMDTWPGEEHLTPFYVNTTKT
jgi:hypothetical protein